VKVVVISSNANPAYICAAGPVGSFGLCVEGLRCGGSARADAGGVQRGVPCFSRSEKRLTSGSSELQTILIVNDNTAGRELPVAGLRTLGCALITASSGP
jgi:hypothetical protein